MKRLDSSNSITHPSLARLPVAAPLYSAHISSSHSSFSQHTRASALAVNVSTNNQHVRLTKQIISLRESHSSDMPGIVWSIFHSSHCIPLRTHSLVSCTLTWKTYAAFGSNTFRQVPRINRLERLRYLHAVRLRPPGNTTEANVT